MKAILSGQTAAAVCIEDGRFYSISLDSPETWSERHECEIPYLFVDAADNLQLENISRSDVIDKLKIEWAKDRGLQLILILLDHEEELQTRLEAAECLDDFLNQDEAAVLSRAFGDALDELFAVERPDKLQGEVHDD